MPGKDVICTDSRSSVPFITNHNSHSFYATSVKNFSKHFQKISRFADDTAKMASKLPLTYTGNY